jgi:hypothetical protein
MELGFDRRIGIAGLILSPIGIGITILFPDARWLGWLFLLLGAVGLVFWLVAETRAKLRNSLSSNFLSASIVILVLGGLGLLYWKAPKPKSGESGPDQSPREPQSQVIREPPPHTEQVPAEHKKQATVPPRGPGYSPPNGAGSPPRLGEGSDTFKDIPDDLLVRWALRVVRNVEEEGLLVDRRRPKYQQGDSPAGAFIFTSEFEACCESDLKGVRGELLKRLGPDGREADELQKWNELFRSELDPSGTSELLKFAPDDASRYLPHLIKLSLALKYRNKSDGDPIPLKFSRLERESPSETDVSIELKDRDTSGYVIVEYDGSWGVFDPGCAKLSPFLVSEANEAEGMSDPILQRAEKEKGWTVSHHVWAVPLRLCNYFESDSLTMRAQPRNSIKVIDVLYLPE